ncbi:hydroxymethylglutaryl-CoA lyase [Alicyclobacillaceae bacterium I2511]|nr:hydroxymethylglutaryl-CoA lyase [Alicyclobacillaceae bacterium I2511]
MKFPDSVELIDVGPRDGLQNEPQPISLDQKRELIRRLAQAGYQRIETASFVHPKWVPQMADAEAVAAYCNELGLTYLALTPNVRGLDRAMAAGVPQVAVFIGASSPFNQKNINRTTDEALQEVEPVFSRAKSGGLFVRGYVSTAFSCPYQGKVSFPEVQHVVDRFVQLGADEIDIGDTDGHANPRGVYERFARLQELYPQTVFVAHFHDTWKMGLANVLAALQAGIRKFDGSVGGLGGCPYAPGAAGNVATEDLALMFAEMGVDTGLDLPVIQETARFARSLSSRVCLPTGISGL